MRYYIYYRDHKVKKHFPTNEVGYISREKAIQTLKQVFNYYASKNDYFEMSFIDGFYIGMIYDSDYFVSLFKIVESKQ